MTPATGSRGPTDPVIRISPGSVPHSQPRRAGSVQTNLFGRTPDDPTAGFRRHMRQLADELRAEMGEERRISKDEDNPVTENPVEETAAEVEGEPEAESTGLSTCPSVRVSCPSVSVGQASRLSD